MRPVALQHQKPQSALRKMRYVAVTLAAWPPDHAGDPLSQPLSSKHPQHQNFGTASVLATYQTTNMRKDAYNSGR